MKRTLLLLLVILSGYSNTLAQIKDVKPERSKLEGIWGYKDAQSSYITREANKAVERLGEADLTIEYEIRWKEGYDHDLIVTKVIFGTKTPEIVKGSTYKVGDVLQIKVLKVTDQYYQYNIKYKGFDQRDQFLFRITKEQQQQIESSKTGKTI